MTREQVQSDQKVKVNRRQTSTKALYVLLVLQTVLMFVLGVFGNKVAEEIKFSPKWVFISTFFFMVTSLAVTLAISRYQNKKLGLVKPTSWAEKLARLMLNRIVTIFPLSIVLGALISLLSVLLTPLTTIEGVGKSTQLLILPGLTIHSYEVVTYIVGAITLFLISRKRQDVSLILSYSIGFALSVSLSFMMLRSEDNDTYYTFIGWNLIMIVTGLIMRSHTVEALYSDLKGLLQKLTKERND